MGVKFKSREPRVEVNLTSIESSLNAEWRKGKPTSPLGFDLLYGSEVRKLILRAQGTRLIRDIPAADLELPLHELEAKHLVPAVQEFVGKLASGLTPEPSVG